MRSIAMLAIAGLLAVLAPASAQPLAAVFGRPRPEPRARLFGGASEPPLASSSAVVVVAETCKTPWELISEHPLLSGVARAIKRGNDTALWSLLNDPDAPITVLAPDNEALTSAARALGIPLSAALNGSEPMVSAILRAHVLNTTNSLSELGPESTVTSLAGTPVKVFSPTLVAENRSSKKAPPPPVAADDDRAPAPAPAAPAPAPAPSKAASKKGAEEDRAAVDPAEPVPRRRLSSNRRALAEAATYVNKDATTSLNTPDPNVGGSAIVSTVVDAINGALGGNSTAAASGSGNSTGSGISPVDALLNSFISLFAGIMGGGGGGGDTGGMMDPGNSSSLFMGNGPASLGPGWKVSKRRGCAGGCSRVVDWTFAPVGKTAASSLPDNATFAVLRNATVEAGNVRTCGGYLHVVDGVLVPELLSKKEKGKGDSRAAVLELGDGNGAAVSRVTVPLDRSVDDDTGLARANVTVEYLGKVAKSVAARDKAAAAAAAAAAKKAASAASPAPAPAPAVPAKKDAKEDEGDAAAAAPSPAPEVSQASAKKATAPTAAEKAPDAPKVVGETIAPKGSKQPSA